MKAQFKASILVTSILITLSQGISLAQSSGRGGKAGSGGGNVVVCFDHEEIAKKIKANRNMISPQLWEAYQGHITSIEILDLWEITNPKGRFYGKRELFVKSAQSEADFFKQLDQYYAKIYHETIPEYETDPKIVPHNTPTALSLSIPESRVHFTPNMVKYQNDSGESMDFTAEPLCLLTTMIVQTGVEFGQGELTIDERLFKHAKHSAMSRAVSYLHEWVYRPLLVAGDDSSLRAQRVVQMFISKSPNDTLLSWARELLNYGTRNTIKIGYKEFHILSLNTNRDRIQISVTQKDELSSVISESVGKIRTLWLNEYTLLLNSNAYVIDFKNGLKPKIIPEIERALSQANEILKTHPAKDLLLFVMKQHLEACYLRPLISKYHTYFHNFINSPSWPTSRPDRYQHSFGFKTNYITEVPFNEFEKKSPQFVDYDITQDWVQFETVEIYLKFLTWRASLFLPMP